MLLYGSYNERGTWFLFRTLNVYFKYFLDLLSTIVLSTSIVLSIHLLIQVITSAEREGLKPNYSMRLMTRDTRVCAK